MTRFLSAFSPFIACTMLVACLSAAPVVAAAPWFLGPTFAYTIGVNAPDDVTFTSGPQRLNIGLQGMIETSRTIQIRTALTYRTEQADFQQPAPNLKPVVTPGGGGGGSSSTEKILSSISANAVVFEASAHFPIARLDSSGSVLTIGLGGFFDRTLSASQTDDYRGVTGWPEPKTASEDFPTSWGGGATLNAGLSFPLGDTHLLFDVKYIVRSAPASASQYSWLSNGGVSICAGVLF